MASARQVRALRLALYGKIAGMTAEATDVRPGTGVLSYLDEDAGDVKLTWEHGNADDIATARQTFDTLRRQGFLAYKVTSGSRTRAAQREQIRAFDPEAEQIVLAPPLRGG